MAETAGHAAEPLSRVIAFGRARRATLASLARAAATETIGGPLPAGAIRATLVAPHADAEPVAADAPFPLTAVPVPPNTADAHAESPDAEAWRTIAGAMGGAPTPGASPAAGAAWLAANEQAVVPDAASGAAPAEVTLIAGLDDGFHLGAAVALTRRLCAPGAAGRITLMLVCPGGGPDGRGEAAALDGVLAWAETVEAGTGSPPVRIDLVPESPAGDNRFAIDHAAVALAQRLAAAPAPPEGDGLAAVVPACLTYPRHEIRAGLTRIFARSAMLHMRYDNWTDENGYVAEALYRRHRAYVQRPDVENAWLLSDEHLTLSLDPGQTVSWRTLDDDWRERSETVLDEAFRAPTGTRMETVNRLMAAHHDSGFRGMGVDAFYHDARAHVDDQAETVVHRVAADLFAWWRDGTRALEDGRNLLRVLIAFQRERRDNIEERTSSVWLYADQIRAQVMGNEERAAALSWWDRLRGRHWSVLRRHVSLTMEYYALVTRAAAWNHGMAVLDAVIDKLEALAAQVDAIAADLDTELAHLGHDLDAVVELFNLPVAAQAPVFRLFDRDAVGRLSDQLAVDKGLQTSAAHAIRADVLGAAGDATGRDAFSRTRERLEAASFGGDLIDAAAAWTEEAQRRADETIDQPVFTADILDTAIRPRTPLSDEAAEAGDLAAEEAEHEAAIEDGDGKLPDPGEPPAALTEALHAAPTLPGYLGEAVRAAGAEARAHPTALPSRAIVDDPRWAVLRRALGAEIDGDPAVVPIPLATNAVHLLYAYPLSGEGMRAFRDTLATHTDALREASGVDPRAAFGLVETARVVARDAGEDAPAADGASPDADETAEPAPG